MPSPFTLPPPPSPLLTASPAVLEVPSPISTPRSPSRARLSSGLSVAESSGLVGLAARLVLHAADKEVWDEARRHAVKQILSGRTRIEEVQDIPPLLVDKALRPKGYEVPGPQLQMLGTGSFGRVMKVRRKKDGRVFAVKRQFLGDEAHDVVPVLRETSILNVLKGACNIVQIEDAFLVRPSSDGAEVWTVLEYFPSNLQRVSLRFRTEEPCRRAIFQVLMGLHSLHSADIIHRDLKPENMLVDLGRSPPNTVRVCLCDFGMSRSVHGFEDAARHDMSAMSPLMKLSDRVTSCWWRAPEMWGWADTKQMTKRDLKSLDVFALGLVWAGLLARRSVITHEEGVDPPKFRLLEILRKVDRPADGELNELGFGADVAEFVSDVLSNNLEAVRAEISSPEWPENQARREALLHQPYAGIRDWILKHNKQLSPGSPSLDLIEEATRFSYRRRPTVEMLLNDPYFDDLRAETPPRHWAHREAPHFDDVREALEVEQKRQKVAAQRTQELRALQQSDNRGAEANAEDAFMNRIANKAAKQVEESVKNVCDRVRAELVTTQQHRNFDLLQF